MRVICPNNISGKKEPARIVKECMYSYHYHRNRAIVRRDRTGSLVLFGILGIAALYGVYCLSTLVRS